MTIKLSLVFSTLLFLGCDSRKNDDINSICENSPELCADFHVISDCRFKRTTVIRARYYDKIEPSDIHKVELLTQLDEYEACLESSLFKKLSNKANHKEHRFENYFATQAIIKKQLKETKNMQDPLVAYYMWTHYQDSQARQRFLSAASKDDVTDPLLLIKLATTYPKEEPQASLNQLYKALRVSQSLENIPISTFPMIMTLFYQNKHFEEAYIWAVISKRLDKQEEYPINLELILKKGLLGGIKVITNEKDLEALADDYYDALNDGVFKQKAPIII
jgi:hypothetical protein